MFAKVFGQIFDSSIAEDYNCRRMFMDLLVLADPTGAVDMTPEAIARRTNVPIEEVRKYIAELSSPDPASRSQVEQGKRLTPLDSNRDWGWQIVNYQHYRKLKDQEALRSYFRDAQRKHRAKKRDVKDNSLTKLNGNGQSLTPSSPSSSVSVLKLKEGVRGRFEEWIIIRKEMGKAPKDWVKMFDEQIKWLTQYPEKLQIEILSASIRNNWQGLHEPKNGSNGNGKPKEGRDPYEPMSDKLWQLKHGSS